jgi:hypothetical protein
LNLFLAAFLFSSIIPTVSVDTAAPAQFTKVLTPSVSFRAEEASATRSAWVDSNGWRFLRDPEGRFYYDAPGAAAPLAAAEAFTFGVHAAIHTDEAGILPLSKMLDFLKHESGEDLPALVNIGFIDDGSAASGEFMNLLVRRNLLFRVVKQPDPKLDLNVGLGFPGYPKSEAVNPSLLAEKVRGNLTDEKRLLRIYGSELVVGRLFDNAHTARLCLINYGASKAAVEGIRVRILGTYPKVSVVQYNAPNLHIQDVSTDAAGTEFTLPELKTFAIVTFSH